MSIQSARRDMRKLARAQEADAKAASRASRTQQRQQAAIERDRANG